ncbi:MAG: PEP-CTERM sorting domain-containing protein [Gemmatimonadaceae bacterium]
MISLRPLRQLAGAFALAAVGATSLQAQVVWTDWTSTGANAVYGSMAIGSGVNVSYTGPFSFAQLGCGTDYWTPNTYTGPGVPNAPPACDIIELDAGGLKTITFSQAVLNPYISLVSWNGQPSVTFNGPVSVIANGCGYWGCGAMSASGNTITTNGGEVHGTIQLAGSYTQITFTDNSENWHGLTVGAAAVVTPEPSTYVLMATGMIGVFGIARRRRA